MTKQVVWGIAIVVILIISFSALRIIGAFVNSGTEIIEKTIDADNVLYNYEWFKQQNEDHLALLNKIEAAEEVKKQFKEDAGPRFEWTFEDKNESSRLSSIVLGLKHQSEDLISTYNARSKMANRKIFKDDVLPEQLK